MTDYELVASQELVAFQDEIQMGEVIEVEAPADLPANSQFEVIHEGKAWTASVVRPSVCE
jgi:translation elongation factor EF-4